MGSEVGRKEELEDAPQEIEVAGIALDNTDIQRVCVSCKQGRSLWGMRRWVYVLSVARLTSYRILKR